MSILSFLIALLPTLWTPAAGLPVEASAEIITGTWKGVLTQDRGGFQPEYYFQLKLTEQNGKIVGSSYVSVNSIYANWQLRATLKDNVLYFQETELGRHTQMDDLYWCLKQGKLSLKMVDYQWVLYGPWSGSSELGGCVPGKIRLTKVVPQV